MKALCIADDVCFSEKSPEHKSVASLDPRYVSVPELLYSGYKNNYFLTTGKRWRSWLRLCTTRWKVVVSIPDGVTGIFQSFYDPGVDPASNRNEYQESFLGVKTAGA
jgi:hypothetical protein